MHCQITSSTSLMQIRNRHLITLLSNGPEHTRWGLSVSSCHLKGSSRGWVKLVSHKTSVMQTSDIVWCNKKSAGIKLNRCKFFWTNSNQENEFILDLYHAPVAYLICCSEPWSYFITALVTSCGHDTLKEQSSFGKELEKWLWQLFFIPTINPIGNTLSLWPALNQSGQKQSRRTSPSSKTN